uniref:Cytochrome c oxidase subunit 6b-1 n=1 Tax=Arundo donax TaxID=35708 RepID=A0A0A9E3T3_ARUDO
MATEGKAPSLAEEYSLPPQEVPVKSSAEDQSAVSTTAEAAPEKNAETPPVNETTAAVEETSETPEVKESSEEPEAEDSPAAEESSEAAEEAADEKPEIKIETAPADFRFPTTNQTRHCFTRYIEYHRCVAAKGEGAPECEKFAKYYRSLCPSEWIERWNEQRENGTFPGPL